MSKQLLLLLSIIMLWVSVTILIFKDSERFHRLADLGARMTLLNQSSQLDKCTPPKFVFPKETLISDEPLPEKVKNSFKNTIAITACFGLDNQGTSLNTEPIESGGTAHMFEQGLFISARHIFLITMVQLNQRGRPFFIDKNGLPRSDHYQYTFYGTANIDGQEVNFPLELIAMGDPYHPQDLAVFKAKNPPSQLTPLEFGPPANLSDVVYSSGRVPSFHPLGDDLNRVQKEVLMDFINFNFKGQVAGIITDLPNNTYAGLKKIYRIRTTIEPGFSGGPVFDKNGKIIGMTASVTPGLSFSYAISAEDQEMFINRLKNKGIIPKK